MTVITPTPVATAPAPAPTPARTGISWWRKALAELVGTFFLVFVAAGVEMAAVLVPGSIDRLVKAAGPGLVILALIFALGGVSGAHFNPVVTMVFALRGTFSLRWVPVYLGAQFVGALLAASTLRAIWGTVRDVGVNEVHGIDPGGAWLLEATLTMLLVLVVLNVAHQHSLVGPDAALPVGATIIAAGLFGGEFTGASMNPTRSLAPAVVSGHWAHQWVYLVGPVSGALLGLAIVAVLHPRSNEDERRSAEGDEVD